MVKSDVEVLDRFGTVYNFTGVDYYTTGSYISITKREEFTSPLGIQLPESARYEIAVDIFFNPIHVRIEKTKPAVGKEGTPPPKKSMVK